MAPRPTRPSAKPFEHAPMLAEAGKLYACVYEGKTYDAGDKLGFLKATVEIALQNSELGGGFREYLKGLKL